MSVQCRGVPQWTLWAPYGDPLQCCMCFYSMYRDPNNLDLYRSTCNMAVDPHMAPIVSTVDTLIIDQTWPLGTEYSLSMFSYTLYILYNTVKCHIFILLSSKNMIQLLQNSRQKHIYFRICLILVYMKIYKAIGR